MPRLDEDFVAQIILTVEDAPLPRGPLDPVEIEGVDPAVRSYHVEKLHDQGLVRARNWRTDQRGDDWRAYDLTRKGHDVARWIRENQDWKKRTWKHAKATGLGLLGAMEALALAKEVLG